MPKIKQNLQVQIDSVCEEEWGEQGGQGVGCRGLVDTGDAG